jgi:hypothetical protein
LNLLDFTDSLTQNQIFNEVMVKNHIDPNLIKGVVTCYEEIKTWLIETLIQKGLIVNGCINGHPIDQFIHAADTFDQKMF